MTGVGFVGARARYGAAALGALSGFPMTLCAPGQPHGSFSASLFKLKFVRAAQLNAFLCQWLREFL